MPSRLGSPLGKERSSRVLVRGCDFLGVESGVKDTSMRVLVTPGGCASGVGNPEERDSEQAHSLDSLGGWRKEGGRDTSFRRAQATMGKEAEDKESGLWIGSNP